MNNLKKLVLNRKDETKKIKKINMEKKGTDKKRKNERSRKKIRLTGLAHTALVDITFSPALYYLRKKKSHARVRNDLRREPSSVIRARAAPQPSPLSAGAGLSRLHLRPPTVPRYRSMIHEEPRRARRSAEGLDRRMRTSVSDFPIRSEVAVRK
jgi:hypothetical protein